MTAAGSADGGGGLTRRAFLVAASAAGVAVVGGAWWLGASRDPSALSALSAGDLPEVSDSARAGLAGYFDGADLGSITAIGDVVLEALDAEGSTSEAVEVLAPTLELAGSGADALRAAVSDDFVGRRVRTAGGWVLSATEASACALCSVLGIDSADA